MGRFVSAPSPKDKEEDGSSLNHEFFLRRAFKLLSLMEYFHCNKECGENNEKKSSGSPNISSYHKQQPHSPKMPFSQGRIWQLLQHDSAGLMTGD